MVAIGKFAYIHRQNSYCLQTSWPFSNLCKVQNEQTVISGGLPARFGCDRAPVAVTVAVGPCCGCDFGSLSRFFSALCKVIV